MSFCRYTRMDESKIKELSLKIEHLTDDAAKRRKTLDQEVTETLTAQVNYVVKDISPLFLRIYFYVPHRWGDGYWYLQMLIAFICSHFLICQSPFFHLSDRTRQNC